MLFITKSVIILSSYFVIFIVFLHIFLYLLSFILLLYYIINFNLSFTHPISSYPIFWLRNSFLFRLLNQLSDKLHDITPEHIRLRFVNSLSNNFLTRVQVSSSMLTTLFYFFLLIRFL